MGKKLKKSKNESFAYSNSVLARLDLLLEVYKNPNLATNEIVDACESQSSLAAFSLPEKGIFSLSRNSMYKYANQSIKDIFVPNGYKNEEQCGYAYLDWLRNQVKAAAVKQRTNRTKAAREQRFEDRQKDLVSKINLLREHSLGMGKAYLNLLTSVKRLIRDEALDQLTRHKLIIILDDHDRLYTDLFEEVGTIRPDNVEIIINEATKKGKTL